MPECKNSKKICVIGGGLWGENHIRTLHAMGNLGGIVENDKNRLKSLVDKYSSVKGYSSLEDALDYGYDGYIVATPAETHFAIGSMLMEKNQNTLIEKPLSLCSMDSLKLVRLSEEYKSKLMVGHLMLFHPAVIKLKELIDQGTVGDLRYIYSNRLNLGRVRTEENALWSLGPHDISILNYLIGKLPDTIKASGGCYLQNGIDDMVIASYSYPDNIKAHIFVSWLHPFKEHRITVIGSKAMLIFEDSSPEKNILFYDSGIDMVDRKPVKREKPAKVIPYETSSPLDNELKYFIDHLDSAITVSDGKSGHEVVRILEKTDDYLHSYPEYK
jgi:UDP-2-acetamido-3-amino-2,3-dideoxy-glucuronate N-acetyltransferase